MHRSAVNRSRPPGITLLAAAALLWILSEEPAQAYLDPGSISLLFQALIAAALGSLLVLKRYWSQLIYWVRRRFSSKPEDEGG